MSLMHSPAPHPLLKEQQHHYLILSLITFPASFLQFIDKLNIKFTGEQTKHKKYKENNTAYPGRNMFKLPFSQYNIIIKKSNF